MPISKITFKRNYSINLILHEHVHLGLEYDLNQGENAMDALISCDQFVKEGVEILFGKDNVAAITIANQPIPDRQVEKDAELIGQSLEDQISTCTEIKVLESYKFIVKGNSFYQDIYEKKMQELLSN